MVYTRCWKCYMTMLRPFFGGLFGLSTVGLILSVYLLPAGGAAAASLNTHRSAPLALLILKRMGSQKSKVGPVLMILPENMWHQMPSGERGHCWRGRPRLTGMLAVNLRPDRLTHPELGGSGAFAAVRGDVGLPLRIAPSVHVSPQQRDVGRILPAQVWNTNTKKPLRAIRIWRHFNSFTNIYCPPWLWFQLCSVCTQTRQTRPTSFWFICKSMRWYKLL